MTKGKPAYVTPELLRRNIPTVGPVLLLTVHGVVGHAGIEPDDDCPDGVVVLMDEKLKSEKINDGDAQHTSPQSRVRPCKRTIRQSEDGDDHEEDKDTNQTGVDYKQMPFTFLSL